MIARAVESWRRARWFARFRRARLGMPLQFMDAKKRRDFKGLAIFRK